MIDLLTRIILRLAQRTDLNCTTVINVTQQVFIAPYPQSSKSTIQLSIFFVIVTTFTLPLSPPVTLTFQDTTCYLRLESFTSMYLLTIHLLTTSLINVHPFYPCLQLQIRLQLSWKCAKCFVLVIKLTDINEVTYEICTYIWRPTNFCYLRVNFSKFSSRIYNKAIKRHLLITTC